MARNKSETGMAISGMSYFSDSFVSGIAKFLGNGTKVVWDKELGVIDFHNKEGFLLMRSNGVLVVEAGSFSGPRQYIKNPMILSFVSGDAKNSVITFNNPVTRESLTVNMRNPGRE